MSNGNYLTWISGNSLNVASEKSDNTSWTLSETAITNVADSTRQLWWNHANPRFACYTDKEEDSGYLRPEFYVKTGGTYTIHVDNDLYDVVATYMVNNQLTVCDASGQSAPTGWSTMAAAFTSALQTKYQLDKARSGTENIVEKFLQAYDYAVGKYGSSYDFLGRIESGMISQSGRIAIFGQNGVDTDTTLIIVIASVVAVAAVGGYFFLRRKKEQ